MCPPMTVDRGIPVRGRDILLNSKNRDPNCGKCMSGFLMSRSSSLGTVRDLIGLGFILIQDRYYGLHLSWPFSSEESTLPELIRQILVLVNKEIRKECLRPRPPGGNVKLYVRKD
nr:MAG TPA: hypothetical protein [Caudoviricetes sp.]DAZ17794.1 MAG TPA: hypothetical protein [Caudoviricetes sp.]